MAGKFSLILTLLTLASGLLWLLDAKLWRPRRLAALARARESAGGNLGEQAEQALTARLPGAETAESVFPVLLLVLVLRSFVYEPFQIPSGSMMPTLLVGDFILVEKFAYSLRDPVWRKELVKIDEPKRGDVVVFKFPLNPEIDYIKRIIGMPGDRIIYRNQTLYVGKDCAHGTPDCPEPVQVASKFEEQGMLGADLTLRFEEDLLGSKHQIYRMPVARQGVYPYSQSPERINDWVVPAGHYFVMGDNRDNSQDSRYWGLLPADHLVGKATAIWISFEFNPERPALLRWIPAGVRFERIGGID